MITNYSEIFFSKKENSFQHNVGSDFACFLLWKSARQFREKIIKVLSSRFEILLESEIEWTEKHFHSNAQRLYEAPIYLSCKQDEIRSLHSEKIGDTKFILIIVKDSNPNYTYAQSVSGKIEMSNLNIVNIKYLFRDWISEDTGIKYGVHSTNNIYEFYYQVPLLLGIDRFKRLINSEIIDEPFIKRDLDGAEGWKNYNELFQFLNTTVNYLVLRGFESLPNFNPEMDIDFLTDNYQRLASALGAKQKKGQLYKGKVIVNNKEISIDLRFVGDKYYDVNWEKNMLENKIVSNGIYIPREDDYFFSLLFHSKVQKSSVKYKYILILESISKSLNFEWYKSEYINDNNIIGQILKGYYQSYSYFFEPPIDQGVYKNKDIINFLPKITTSGNQRTSKSLIKSILAKFIPKALVPHIKRLISR